MRLESVENANDQASIVAKTIAGQPANYDVIPWFWSNQYDIRLQTIGLSSGYDQTVVRGNPEDRSFSVIYLKEDRVIAIDCVNAVKDYAQGRKLIAANIPLADIEIARDPSLPLKDFARAM